MKKLFIILLLFSSSFALAHPTTKAEKKEVYEFIHSQLKQGKITLQVAQKMWTAYIRCCKEK